MKNLKNLKNLISQIDRSIEQAKNLPPLKEVGYTSLIVTIYLPIDEVPEDPTHNRFAKPIDDLEYAISQLRIPGLLPSDGVRIEVKENLGE